MATIAETRNDIKTYTIVLLCMGILQAGLSIVSLNIITFIPAIIILAGVSWLFHIVVSKGFPVNSYDSADSAVKMAWITAVIILFIGIIVAILVGIAVYQVEEEIEETEETNESKGIMTIFNEFLFIAMIFILGIYVVIVVLGIITDKKIRYKPSSSSAIEMTTM